METKVNEIKVNGAEIIQNAPKKEQKVSISYTLKATANNITKLIDNKIITAEDGKTMRSIHKKAVEHWIGLEMGI